MPLNDSEKSMLQFNLSCYLDEYEVERLLILADMNPTIKTALFLMLDSPNFNIQLNLLDKIKETVKEQLN